LLLSERLENAADRRCYGVDRTARERDRQTGRQADICDLRS
jgi:hypothetical protein